MKVLVIDMREGGDWSLDLLFAGLVKNLGWNNVDMFPFRRKHLELIDPGKSDWGQERRSLGWTEDNVYIPDLSERDVKKSLMAGEYDYIFLDERQESYEMFVRVGGPFSPKKTKVVVVAGHDRFWNHSPSAVASLYGDRLSTMFLDNWQPEYDELPFVRLINWSHNFEHYWDSSKRDEFLQNKVYDICFMGYNSHPARATIIDHVQNRWGHLNNFILFERQPDTMEKFIPKSEFFKVIAQSKICLNISGAAVSGKALRFYEIPYVGSFMLTQQTAYKQLDPFVHGKHCLYFDNLEQLDAHVDSMLRYDWIREMMAAEGHRHSLEKHSVVARVKYVLENI